MFWVNIIVFTVLLLGFSYCIEEAMTASRWWSIGTFSFAISLGSLYGRALGRAMLYRRLHRELMDAILGEVQDSGAPRQGAGDRDL